MILFFHYYCRVSERTRQQIIDAAILIFHHDGSAPLEKVADKASVTRRTLHRYFSDRKALLIACRADICKRCSEAMSHVLNGPHDPMTKLEQLLYAAIDCGVKYAFFQHVHNGPDHVHRTDGDCREYDALRNRLCQFFEQLQDDGIITRKLTTAWIFAMLTGVVNAAMKTDGTGPDTARNLKQLAWYSFSRAIGL